MRKTTALCFLLTTLAVAAHAATVSINPPNQSVTAGQSFTVDVVIEDVIDLASWQIDLGFTPSVLRADSTEEGAFLTSLGSTTFFVEGTIDNAAGSVTFTGSTIIGPDPGVNGSGVLARFHLTALSAGTSPVNLFGEIFLDSFTQGMVVDLSSGSVTVTDVTGVVPEPSSLVMSAIGLLLCAGWRRAGRRPRAVRD